VPVRCFDTLPTTTLQQHEPVDETMQHRHTSSTRTRDHTAHNTIPQTAHALHLLTLRRCIAATLSVADTTGDDVDGTLTTASAGSVLGLSLRLRRLGDAVDSANSAPSGVDVPTASER
jgi:hypothetical protein